MVGRVEPTMEEPCAQVGRDGYGGEDGAMDIGPEVAPNTCHCLA